MAVLPYAPRGDNIVGDAFRYANYAYRAYNAGERAYNEFRDRYYGEANRQRDNFAGYFNRLISNSTQHRLSRPSVYATTSTPSSARSSAYYSHRLPSRRRMRRRRTGRRIGRRRIRSSRRRRVYSGGYTPKFKRVRV